LLTYTFNYFVIIAVSVFDRRQHSYHDKFWINSPIMYLKMLFVAFLSWGSRSGSRSTSSRRLITPVFSSLFNSKSWWKNTVLLKSESIRTIKWGTEENLISGFFSELLADILAPSRAESVCRKAKIWDTHQLFPLFLYLNCFYWFNFLFPEMLYFNSLFASRL